MRSLALSLQLAGQRRQPGRWRRQTIGLCAGAALAAGCHGRTPPLGAAGTGCTSTEIFYGGAAGTPELNAATFDSAWTIIARSHWDSTYNGVNWTAVRDSLRPRALRANSTGELRSVLAAMLGTLGQSHFSVIPSDVSGGTASGVRDQTGDIGATIRDVDGAILVTAVRRGSAAEKSGIRPGTEIESVDGCVVAGRRPVDGVALEERRAKLTHWSAVTHLLRGPVGDSVRIGVRDASGRRSVHLIERRVTDGLVTQVGNLPPTSAFVETEQRIVQGRRIGVIRFNLWMPVLSEGLRRAVDSLRNSDGIVLDLRGNLGGMGTMATGVAGYFVDSALTLGTMIQKGSRQRYIINPQRVNARNERVIPYAGPLAIVVDELSVSTTEIFVGGLQALNRARVFGSQTAGEALPAMAERLPNGDVLYHAIANFLSPAGQPVEGAGVVPDVAVPVTRSQLVKGRDPALQAALSWAAGARGVPKPQP